MGFLICLISWAWPVWASQTANQQIDTQSSFFIVAHNSPQMLKMRSGGEEYAFSCIAYAKFVLGVPQSIKWGDAKDLKPTVDKPYVGGLVLTTEGKFGHVAVITAIKGSQLELIEGNWKPNEISTRSLDISSPLIRGFR